MQLDPWSCVDENESDSASEKFEDNFVDQQALNSSSNLPDSESYLNRLESKLARLKKSGPRSEKEIIQSLSETRQDCMVRLLSESTLNLTEEDLDDKQIETKWLKNHLNPQQPLTVLELVELVKADYLAKQTERDSQE